MPRDQFRLLMQEFHRAEEPDKVGQLASPVILLPYDATGALMPVAHVVMNTPTGITLVCHVAVAANNQEMRHAALGSPVRLKRSRTGRLEIVGLDKRAPGTLYNYTLNLSTAVMTSGNVSALTTRVVNLGELASVTSVGFGQTPLAAVAMYDASSNVVTIVWPGGV